MTEPIPLLKQPIEESVQPNAELGLTDERCRQLVEKFVKTVKANSATARDIQGMLSRAETVLKEQPPSDDKPKVPLYLLLIDQLHEFEAEPANESRVEGLRNAIRLVLVAEKTERSLKAAEVLAVEAKKIDGLTQLLNHAALKEDAHRLLKTERRKDRPFGIVMIDLDFFKSVNDTYGHKVGDQVLREIGTILRNIIREPGVYRYGGEEFAVVIKDDAQAIQAIIERINEHLREYPLTTAADGTQVSVTCSIGWVMDSEIPADCSAEDAIDLADQAQYAAKKGGRNRSIRYGGDDVAEISKQPTEEVAIEKVTQLVKSLDLYIQNLYDFPSVEVAEVKEMRAGSLNDFLKAMDLREPELSKLKFGMLAFIRGQSQS